MSSGRQQALSGHCSPGWAFSWPPEADGSSCGALDLRSLRAGELDPLDCLFARRPALPAHTRQQLRTPEQQLVQDVTLQPKQLPVSSSWGALDLRSLRAGELDPLDCLFARRPALPAHTHQKLRKPEQQRLTWPFTAMSLQRLLLPASSSWGALDMRSLLAGELDPLDCLFAHSPALPAHCSS